MAQSIYDIKVSDINGKEISLNDYRGKALLIVNTASKCGFTPQYKGLEELHRKYKDRGFAVLGFPCNQFGAQEPGDENEIKNFCSLTYDVTFPMFSKIDVNGAHSTPLYQFLKTECPGILGTEGIKWNFTKFLVDQTGAPVKRFAPNDAPEKLTGDIENLLR
jgi:glutathione peroxidase